MEIKEKKKEGKGGKRKIEKDRAQRKDIGKDTVEKLWKYKEQSLFVVVYFLLFMYLSRKWFVTSVMVSERLIFL